MNDKIKPEFFRDFSYDKGLLPNKALRDLEEKVSNLDEAKPRTGFTIGWPGWGLLYSMILCHHREGGQGIIVETGTNLGVTTTILAQALIDAKVQDPKVLTFELLEENLAKAARLWEKAGVSSVVQSFPGDTKETMMNGLGIVEEKSVRFAFLDASHLEKDVEPEFRMLFPKLADDAIVAFDNTRATSLGYSSDRNVNGFLRRVSSDYGGSVVNFPFCSWYTPGLAIWQKNPGLQTSD